MAAASSNPSNSASAAAATVELRDEPGEQETSTPPSECTNWLLDGRPKRLAAVLRPINEGNRTVSEIPRDGTRRLVSERDDDRSRRFREPKHRLHPQLYPHTARHRLDPVVSQRGFRLCTRSHTAAGPTFLTTQSRLRNDTGDEGYLKALSELLPREWCMNRDQAARHVQQPQLQPQHREAAQPTTRSRNTARRTKTANRLSIPSAGTAEHQHATSQSLQTGHEHVPSQQGIAILTTKARCGYTDSHWLASDFCFCLICSATALFTCINVTWYGGPSWSAFAFRIARIAAFSRSRPTNPS